MATAPAITITFLGTGAGVPSPERGLPAVALQRGGELFLLDCGEGTQVQYRRAGLGFAPLTAVLISHMHGDHVTGLMGLLMSLRMADRQEPLGLFGPPGLGAYVRLNQRALHTRLGYPIRIREEEGTALLHATEQYRILAAPLEHRILCLGFRFEEYPRPGRFDLEAARRLGVPEGPLYGSLQRGDPVTLEDGRTIAPGEVLGPPRPGAIVAYCTDTRPCAAAIELARGADVLIYEGTFEAALASEAQRKGHSTVADAARVAAAAGVRQLLITHLSPRYGEVSALRDEARALFPDTQIARDLMRWEVYHREE